MKSTTCKTIYLSGIFYKDQKKNYFRVNKKRTALCTKIESD